MQIVALPALTREFPPEALPERKDGADQDSAAVADDESAKAAKLKAMQERLEQWKKQTAA